MDALKLLRGKAVPPREAHAVLTRRVEQIADDIPHHLQVNWQPTGCGVSKICNLSLLILVCFRYSFATSEDSTFVFKDTPGPSFQACPVKDSSGLWNAKHCFVFLGVDLLQKSS